MMREINDAWKSTCRVLLGEEIGELEDYKNYLQEYIELPTERKSALSGKTIVVSGAQISEKARFIDNEEVEKYRQLTSKTRLNINQLKDIDSILDALRENFYYSGSIVLGKSENVIKSNHCANCINVYGSSDVYDSKCVAFSNSIKYDECVFGGDVAAFNRFVIKSFDSRDAVRCMEIAFSFYATDCYFCGNIEFCYDCMFSFNIKSTRHCIGNLQLQKDEYRRIKEKLIEDIRETLKKKREVPSIIEIIGTQRKAAKRKERMEGRTESKGLGGCLVEIENAFQSTTATLFGKKLTDLKKYEGWLLRNVPQMARDKSAVSGKTVYIIAMKCFKSMKGCFVKFDEALELSKKSMNRDGIGKLTLANAAELLDEISFVSPEIVLGKNICIEEVAAYADSAYCYNGSIYSYSKYCAHCFWPRNSEYVFGSSQAALSKCCLKCYHSNYLTRCFEVSDSLSCSDCYFCYNCENLENCMFCFNVKSKRYAIGNVEYPKEEYLRVKKLLLAEIWEKLEKEKKLDINIFNIWAKNWQGSSVWRE